MYLKKKINKYDYTLAQMYTIATKLNFVYTGTRKQTYVIPYAHIHNVYVHIPYKLYISNCANNWLYFTVHVLAQVIYIRNEAYTIHTHKHSYIR